MTNDETPNDERKRRMSQAPVPMAHGERSRARMWRPGYLEIGSLGHSFVIRVSAFVIQVRMDAQSASARKSYALRPLISWRPLK